MSHRDEIAEGAKIEPGVVTPYLCWSNHTFLVLGPHVLCKCNGARKAVILQKPEEHCECGKESSHHHIDGTFGVGRSDVIRVFCFCGTGVKDVARHKKAEQLAASSVYLLHGYPAALQVFVGQSQTVAFRPHYSGTYADGLLPLSFPAGR